MVIFRFRGILVIVIGFKGILDIYKILGGNMVILEVLGIFWTFIVHFGQFRGFGVF